ncbi:TPA: hypothetical protein IXF72_000160 [Enterococcus faecium]|nr:hypothetical protein [Enterococcus faecium]
MELMSRSKLLNFRKKKHKKEQNADSSKAVNNTYVSDLTSLVGYQFTPSYIRTGNRWGTIVKLVNTYGMNRNYEFGWMVKAIPEVKVEGVKAYLIEADKPVSQKDQQEIMHENVGGSTNSYENNLNDKNSDAEINKTVMRIIDLNTASLLDSTANKIIDWKLEILLVSDSPDKISEQLIKLQRLYDEKMYGLKLMSFGGDQRDLFDRLLSEPVGSVYEYTSMSSDFAGNDHAIRKGLDDADGWAIGTMSTSYASGVAFMAMDRSFKGKVLVASHKDATIKGYSEKISASSLWGQLIANNAMANHKRTFHIVLNKFDYFGDPTGETFVAKPSLNSVIEKINLAEEGLNSLELFGDRKDIGDLYRRNLDKLTQIFYLLADRELNPATRVLLKKELGNFYISQKLWDINYEERSKLLVNSSDTMPVLGDFISYLTNAETKAKKTGTEKEIDRIIVLKDTLRTALDSFSKMFNQRTTLKEIGKSDKLQFYYNLSDLRTEINVMEAQFLNTFDFITSQAKKGDIVMIHGFDRLSVETVGLIKKRLTMLEEDGVRLAFLFDTIGSGEDKDGIETADIFNTDGKIYQSFESDFNYTIIGKMTSEELMKYEKKVAPARKGEDDQKLSVDLRQYLTSGRSNKFQIRRPVDLTNNFVIGEFII